MSSKVITTTTSAITPFIEGEHFSIGDTNFIVIFGPSSKLSELLTQVGNTLSAPDQDITLLFSVDPITHLAEPSSEDGPDLIMDDDDKIKSNPRTVMLPSIRSKDIEKCWMRGFVHVIVPSASRYSQFRLACKIRVSKPFEALMKDAHDIDILKSEDYINIGYIPLTWKMLAHPMQIIRNNEAGFLQISANSVKDHFEGSAFLIETMSVVSYDDSGVLCETKVSNNDTIVDLDALEMRFDILYTLAFSVSDLQKLITFGKKTTGSVDIYQVMKIRMTDSGVYTLELVTKDKAAPNLTAHCLIDKEQVLETFKKEDGDSVTSLRKYNPVFKVTDEGVKYDHRYGRVIMAFVYVVDRAFEGFVTAAKKLNLPNVYMSVHEAGAILTTHYDTNEVKLLNRNCVLRTMVAQTTTEQIKPVSKPSLVVHEVFGIQKRELGRFCESNVRESRESEMRGETKFDGVDGTIGIDEKVYGAVESKENDGLDSDDDDKAKPVVRNDGFDSDDASELEGLFSEKKKETKTSTKDESNNEDSDEDSDEDDDEDSDEDDDDEEDDDEDSDDDTSSLDSFIVDDVEETSKSSSKSTKSSTKSSSKRSLQKKVRNAKRIKRSRYIDSEADEA